jgi:hypothetical protein
MILFDPAVITLQDTETDTNINDEEGEKILADTREVTGLDLYQILDFAYVESCGFDSVETNIPSYAIPRADFSLTTSFHSIASSFYALFEPVVYEDDNVLFILDIFGEIPEELLLGARTVNVSKYLGFELIQPEISITNAILLSHKEVSVQSFDPDDLPPNVTFRDEVETPNESGTIIDGDYTKTTFTRVIAEFHDDPDDPAKITNEFPYKAITKIESYVDGLIREIGLDTQTDAYTNSWRLKDGYKKSVDGYFEDGSGGFLNQNAYTETNKLQWRASVSKPGEYEKLRSETKVEGLVLIEGEGDEIVKTPILDASRAKLIINDGSDIIERLPISSEMQVWRYTGADEIEVHAIKIDHLTGRLIKSTTTEHVGTNNVRVRDGDAFNTKQVLLVDEDSDLEEGARVPATFDAGYVTYAVAKELALRKLALLRSPRAIVKVELASFDAGIRRGSIRILVDRDGNETTVIVIGYQVSGLPVKMTLDCVVVEIASES